MNWNWFCARYYVWFFFTEIELRYCCKSFTSRPSLVDRRGQGRCSGERTPLSPMWPKCELSLSVFFPVARGLSPGIRFSPFIQATLYDLICLCLKLICSTCNHKSSCAWLHNLETLILLLLLSATRFKNFKSVHVHFKCNWKFFQL